MDKVRIIDEGGDSVSGINWITGKNRVLQICIHKSDSDINRHARIITVNNYFKTFDDSIYDSDFVIETKKIEDMPKGQTDDETFIMWKEFFEKEFSHPIITLPWCYMDHSGSFN